MRRETHSSGPAVRHPVDVGRPAFRKLADGLRKVDLPRRAIATCRQLRRRPSTSDTVYIAVVDRSATPITSSTRCITASAAASSREIGRDPHNRGMSFRTSPATPTRSAGQAADARDHPWHGRRETAGFAAVRRHGRTVPGQSGHAHLLSKLFNHGLDLQSAIESAATVSAAGNEDGRNGRSASGGAVQRRRSRRAALSCAHPLGRLSGARRSLSIGRTPDAALAGPTRQGRVRTRILGARCGGKDGGDEFGHAALYRRTMARRRGRPGAGAQSRDRGDDRPHAAADKADLDEALAAALRGFRQWRSTSRRSIAPSLMRKAADLLRERADASRAP